MNNQEFGSALVAATIPRGVVEEATERAMFCAQQFIDAAEKPASVKQAFAWELRDAAASLRSALEELGVVEPTPKSDQAMEVLREVIDAQDAVRAATMEEWVGGVHARHSAAWDRARALVHQAAPQTDAATPSTVESPLEADTTASLANAPGLSLDQVLDLLRSMGKTQCEIALKLGISQQYLSDVLLRRRAPGLSVLEPLGLREQILYVKET